MKLNIHNQLQFIFALGLLFAGCKSPNINNGKTNSLGKEKFTVSGKIETNKFILQGIPPTEEVIKERKKKIPYEGYKVYVRKGTLNKITSPIIDSVVTNLNGEFMLELLPGEYLLLSSHQKTRTIFSQFQNDEHYHVDEKCLKKWWENGIKKLTVEDKPVNEVYIYIQKMGSQINGNPCIYSLIRPPTRVIKN